jgi:anti-sigma factor RsiW
MNELTDDFVLCDSLDDYLAGDLPAERRSAFDQHLATCEACRVAVNEWQTLCRDLETATGELESPSPSLLERLQAGAAVPTPPASSDLQKWPDLQKWKVAALVLASLVAALFFASILQPRPPHHELANAPQTQRELSKPTVAKTPSRPKVEFSDDVIGVPIDIGEPNVTVVWLYPTVPAASHTN